jgi:hypothetical protein
LPGDVDFVLVQELLEMTPSSKARMSARGTLLCIDIPATTREEVARAARSAFVTELKALHAKM